MTPSGLKHHIREINPYFFSRSTMRFFGDTMRNFGVRSNTVDDIKVWELYRKRPIKHNLQASTYFRKDNFERI